MTRNAPFHTLLLVAGLGTPLASQALSAPATDVATFLGTTLGAIQAINPAAVPASEEDEPQEVTRGSALRAVINAQAGDTLSFDWFFGTDEGPADANNGVIDFGFFSLNGALTLLASVNDPLELAVGSPFTEQLQPLPSGDYFRTVTLTFDVEGAYALGFAIMDNVDTVVESGLVIDNVRLNGDLVANGGFEDNTFDGEVTSFLHWETLGDVSAWDSLPGPTEGFVGAALLAGNFPVVPVPLPAGLWLLGSALGALGVHRRFR
ncbi:MAG: VPLPA-CTERM sorting domain-containing protein [Gammaproteobacteria bacterium]